MNTPPSVLDRIIVHKKSEVAQRKQTLALEDLKRGMVRSDRSLFDALSKKGPRFVLECKRRSPSRGDMQPKLNVLDLAALYAPFADAVSVLTDNHFFGGSFEDLSAMRANVRQPVLCKDFMIEPYQVYEARHHGADAILLILSVLDDDEYRNVAAIADALGMDVLTEVHDSNECDRAVRLGAKIIGINNRNLGTFEESLDVTRKLAPRIPDDRLVVSESAIASREDVLSLSPVADAFLIGGAIMQAKNPAEKMKELVLGHVKICGLARAEDAKMAETLGATHAGCIFVPESPRCVSVAEAEHVLNACSLRRVGVFRNMDVNEVAQKAKVMGLNVIQLHGQETAAYRKALRGIVPTDMCIWQAVSVGEQAPSLNISGVNNIVLDHGAGGTGEAFDWALLDGLEKRNLVLAGGVGVENIGAAVARGALFVDVNSSLEDAPGIKNHDKLSGFFSTLRDTDLRQARS